MPPMPWETRGRRRYFYFSRWIGGRSCKLYLGKREAAIIAADEVADRKARRLSELEAQRADRARLAPLDRMMTLLDAGCTALLAAELTLAGYHRHDRGPWRRKRGRKGR